MDTRERFNVADLPPLIAEGGEAMIFPDPKHWPGKALKLFLHPDDKDFRGDARAVLEKLAEIQTKLLEFPKNLPERVIVPVELAIDREDTAGMKIAGYFMRWVAWSTQLQWYAEKQFLDDLGIDHVDILNKTILPAFRDLHHTVSWLHKHKPRVLIADFSDTNVLVKGSIAYLCDADSFGFGKYPARLAKQDFTDPLLSKKGPSSNTDWYAYTGLLVQSLLGVKPYGGIYLLPKKPMPMLHAERIRRRISIFHKDVKPTKFTTKWTIAPTMLPDNLFKHLEAVFGKADKRGPFPAHLLDMRWARCGRCGAIHARETCPTTSCYRDSLQEQERRERRAREAAQRVWQEQERHEREDRERREREEQERREREAREAAERVRREQERAERERLSREEEHIRRKREKIESWNRYFTGFRKTGDAHAARFVSKKLGFDLDDDNVGEKFFEMSCYSPDNKAEKAKHLLYLIAATLDAYQLKRYRDIINPMADIFSETRERIIDEIENKIKEHGALKRFWKGMRDENINQGVKEDLVRLKSRKGR
jgi:hypothetical protein